MWDLLSHARSQDELRLLLETIRVVVLPAATVYSPVFTLGMTTRKAA